MTGRLRPTELVTDLGAVRHNTRRLAEITGTDVCAVVKADGYGHGAIAVARAAVEAGATWLAVALVEEGEQLRAAGIDTRTLLLTEPPVTGAARLLAAGLTPTVYSAAMIAELDRLGRERGRPVDVHLKLDTGMARVGVPEVDWRERLVQVGAASGVIVDAISTHLACADDPTAASNTTQLDALDRGLSLAAELGTAPRLVHAANSAGALAHPRARRDLVRTGIALYGLSPSTQVVAADHGLRPVMQLTTEVAFAKWISEGTPVSYGHRWSAPSDGWIATLPVGYADGIPRALTNRGHAAIGDDVLPIAGTVCMDQILVWCGDREPRVGETVTLLGGGDGRTSIEAWASLADTITYEIATSLGGSRLRATRRAVG